MGKMEYMEGYGKGYKPLTTVGYMPPNGSAGKEAKGAFSYKTNPRPVPKKGSSINASGEFGQNADRSKMMGLKDAQAKKENLRGYGC